MTEFKYHIVVDRAWWLVVGFQTSLHMHILHFVDGSLIEA
jgi:hypothetical protein